MAKVGLKDTLSLLAKGYTKKEIDALAAIDEEQEADKEDNPAPAPDPIPEDKKDPEDKQEPDYKQMYEDLLKKQEEKDSEIKEKDEKIKKIQKDNVNSNSLPDIEKERAASQASLIDAIKSFY